MKKFMFILFLFPAVLMAKTYTLDQCVSLALSNNEDLKSGELMVYERENDIGSARSSLFPHLGLSGYYNKDNNYYFSTSLSQTIYKKGVFAAIDNSKLNKLIAEENYIKKRDDVIYNVKESFFRILKYKNEVNLSDKIIKRRKDSKMLIELKYKSGKESYASLKEAELNLLKAEYDKMVSEKNLDDAKKDLMFLMGVSDDEFDVVYEDTTVSIPDYDSLLNVFYENNPDIKISETNIEIARKNKEISKSSLFPYLYLSTSYGYNSMTSSFDWTLSLNLSWTLFDGLSSYYKIKSSDYAIKRNKLEYDYVKRRMAKELEKAYSSLKLSYKKLEIAKASLDVYDIVYKQTKLEYEQGLTSFFMLQQKENDLTRCEYDYINALYNLRVQNSMVEKLVSGRTR